MFMMSVGGILIDVGLVAPFASAFRIILRVNEGSGDGTMVVSSGG